MGMRFKAVFGRFEGLIEKAGDLSGKKKNPARSGGTSHGIRLRRILCQG